MAKEKETWDIIEKMGYIPKKNQSIVVSYAPQNLSAKLLKFFCNQFYVLQICEAEIILVPFKDILPTLKEEIVLKIPLASIKEIEVKESGLNYNINIETEEARILLTTEQKELSNLRVGGYLTGLTTLSKNWHKENLDKTLATLTALNLHK